jgi:hypothetical protein
MDNKKYSFWTNPMGFSIVDLLALMYTVFYFGLMIYNIKVPTDTMKNLVNTLSPSIYIILSGYFTGQAIQQYGSYRYNSPYGNNNYNQPYNNSTYNPINNMQNVPNNAPTNTNINIPNI